MPTISTFYGIDIQMFFEDHPPPHFHAIYAEFEAVIEIGSLEVTRGYLPHRALTLTREWSRLHLDELMENWNLCRDRRAPVKIAPLR